MKLSGLVSVLATATAVVQAQQWPLHNDGLNSVVEWDHYSYILKGQRLFIWSGEIHYWRVPVPELWIDILQKVKAAGFNTVSFYGNWGFHSAKNGELDFENGAHNFERLFELVKDIGLYVLFRPGPYINAETTSGGFPGYVTTGAYGTLRNNDTRYTDAWTPYMTRISQIIAKHQVTNGGNVFIYQIENEYGNQWTNVEEKIPYLPAASYMELLEGTARDNGINVPLIHNNPNMNTKSWSKDYGVGFPGNVDIYGLDHYPSCWSCDLTECTGTNGNVPDFTVYDYYTNFQQVSPTQPSFLAEFQGGSYNPWSGPTGGCVNNTGVDWVNVYYRHNIGQKVSAMNVYMLFGGTNWGGLPFPMVGTSYDYSAPIQENRIIGDKYHETKIFSQFIRVARDLTKVDLVNNGTFYTSTADITTNELRNPDTNSGFYVTTHSNSSSTVYTSFSLDVSTSAGNFTIPQVTSDIVLNGRQSKIIVTDFPIGLNKLIYSTAEVFTLSIQDELPLVFLWLPSGESGEFVLSGNHTASILKKDGCSGMTTKSTSAGLLVSYTQLSGSCALKFDDDTRFMLIDRATAYYTWVPSISIDPSTPENSTVVVQGPYLVRSAMIEKHTLHLTGDWDGTTTLEVFAPATINTVKFNGKIVNSKRQSYRSLVGTLKASYITVSYLQSSLPALTTWKVADGLPERVASYDDSKWILANHSTTPNPTPPATYPILYADEYGYHTGNLLWRGRFSTSVSVTGVALTVIGGVYHGWSAYLNGDYLGSYLGNKSETQSSLGLSFANATMATKSTENVLFIIQDSMGHDEASDATNPRGIFNATLVGAPGLNFTSWKVTGNAGAEDNIDPVRGPYNEGGLHAERLGWHLPGFDDSAWSSSTPQVGLTQDGASFYRTVVPLNIPYGFDVSLGFTLSSTSGSKVRAQLYVNGYQFGKYVPWVGNQVTFPVFPGILDYQGNNTIGLSVWAQDPEGASVSVEWSVLGVVASSFDPGFDAAYLRPEWTDRSAYY